MKYIKFIILIIGLYLLYKLIDQLGGFNKVLENIQLLGWSIILIFIPYVIQLSLNTLSWSLLIKTEKKEYSFFDLIKIKLAGDFLSIFPSGNITADPFRAFLLKNHGVPLVDGMASVYLFRIFLAKAQVIYILVGLISASFLFLGANRDIIQGGFIFTIILAFIMAFVYYIASQKGLATVLLAILDKLKLQFSFIENRRSHFLSFDEKILTFYKSHKKEFILSLSLMISAWFFGAVELYLIFYLLNDPISIYGAVTIESVISVIKVIFFFIPGQVLIQDISTKGMFNILAPGLKEAIVGTYISLRRIREAFWALLGFYIFSRYKMEWKIFKKKNISQENPLS